MSKLQEAARSNSREAYKEFKNHANAMTKKCMLRGTSLRPSFCCEPYLKTLSKFQTGLFSFKAADQPISLDEVESAASIVKRFW